MKKNTLLLLLTLFLVILTVGVAFSDDNTCGYEMMIVPVEQSSDLTTVLSTPAILDAWTTNDPFGNPFSEVYDFTLGVDILAFVVEYSHVGGAIPEQLVKGWKCGTNIPMKHCSFHWTTILPPGTYLLINYFDPVTFKGTYDWAAKVGDVVFGWPNIGATRPLCFTVHN